MIALLCSLIGFIGGFMVVDGFMDGNWVEFGIGMILVSPFLLFALMLLGALCLTLYECISGKKI